MRRVSHPSFDRPGSTRPSRRRNAAGRSKPVPPPGVSLGFNAGRALGFTAGRECAPRVLPVHASCVLFSSGRRNGRVRDAPREGVALAHVARSRRAWWPHLWRQLRRESPRRQLRPLPNCFG
ncbi:hypothetical protein T484DRAFT_3372549 [Baffinella frigidus]|nr:hypothetical protein T484DRAFT_3372549 [Cryptophyta sp. CCMP2293]